MRHYHIRRGFDEKLFHFSYLIWECSGTMAQCVKDQHFHTIEKYPADWDKSDPDLKKTIGTSILRAAIERGSLAFESGAEGLRKVEKAVNNLNHEMEKADLRDQIERLESKLALTQTKTVIYHIHDSVVTGNIEGEVDND